MIGQRNWQKENEMTHSKMISSETDKKHRWVSEILFAKIISFSGEFQVNNSINIV